MDTAKNIYITKKMSLTLIGPGLEEFWKTFVEPWKPGFPKLCSLFPFLLPVSSSSSPLLLLSVLHSHSGNTSPTVPGMGPVMRGGGAEKTQLLRGPTGVGGCQVSWVLKQKQEVPGGLLCPSIAFLHPKVLFCTLCQPWGCEEKGRAWQSVVKLEVMVISGPHLLGKKSSSKAKLF